MHRWTKEEESGDLDLRNLEQPLGYNLLFTEPLVCANHCPIYILSLPVYKVGIRIPSLQTN